MPLVRLRDCDPAAIDATRRLYEASFPASERDDFGGIVDGDFDDDREVLVLLEEDDVRGLCVSSRVSWPALFLEYFAVAPGHRGAGVGSRFLQACLAALLAPDEHGTVLEIERVEAAPADAYRPVRRRFWERNGALAILERFIVPRLDEIGGTLEMTLMWIPRAGHPSPDPLVLARQMFEEGYGLEPADAEALVKQARR